MIKKLPSLASLLRCLLMLLVLICILMPVQRAESAGNKGNSDNKQVVAVANEETVMDPDAEVDNTDRGGQPESFPFYIDAKASLYLMKLPKYAPVAVRDFAPSNALLERLTTEDGEISGVMPEITIGWRPDATLSSGNPLIVEGSFFYTSSSSTQSRLFDYPATVRVGWYSIDGSQSATGLGFGHDLVVETKRRVENFGGELVVAQEMPWTKNVTIRPYMGYSGMLLKQKFSTVADEVQAPPQRMELSEEVTGTYHGFVLGTKITHNTDQIESYLSGSVAAYLLSAKYKGHQYSSAGSYTVDHTDTKTDMAGRFRIEAGSAYVMDRWKFGVNAGAEYLSAVPQIIASDKGTSVGTTEGSPTHIASGSYLAGKIGVDLTYSF